MAWATSASQRAGSLRHARLALVQVASSEPFQPRVYEGVLAVDSHDASQKEHVHMFADRRTGME
eukprot:8825979-Prorocentrum_lima.AAC.1